MFAPFDHGLGGGTPNNYVQDRIFIFTGILILWY